MKVNESFISHHGVKGQEWGERNGPPYPLSRSKKEIKQEKKTKQYEQKQQRKLEKKIQTKKYKQQLKQDKELKKKIKDRKYLSDDEIDKMITRLQKEKDLKKLYLENNSKAKSAEEGRALVSKTLKDIGSSTFKKVAAMVLTGASLYAIGTAVSRVNPNLGSSVATGKAKLNQD